MKRVTRKELDDLYFKVRGGDMSLAEFERVVKMLMGVPMASGKPRTTHECRFFCNGKSYRIAQCKRALQKGE